MSHPSKYETIRGILNKMSTAPLSEKRAWREIFKLLYNDIDTLIDTTIADLPINGLLSGTVTWLTGLTFEISDCVFVIDGTLYTAEGSTVTLSDADATNPRIDVFYADIDGNTGVLEGTAAADPLKPGVDTFSQVEVSFALIPALATEPDGVANTVIYDEDDDWTTSVSSATYVAKAATANPANGTKHIRFTDAPTGQYIRFDRGTATAVVEDLLVIKLSVTDWGRRDALILQFKNGTDYVGNSVVIADGEYGFDRTDLSGYQVIAIPLTDFNLVDLFDILEIQTLTRGSSTMSFDADDIWMQSGLPAIDLSDFARKSISNYFTAAQGSGVTTLTDAATISWDMGVGNVFDVTLDGNRTTAAPTNVRPGFTYILFVRQDATTGSRTLTWNSVFKWPGATAPTLSTGTDDVDVISFVADKDGNLHGALGIGDSS